jgi:hypothetical protein
MAIQPPKYLVYNDTYEITHAQNFESQNSIPFISNDFVKPKYNPEKKEVYEGATTAEILQINAEKELYAETNKYIKRTEDGRTAYAQISAEFRLAKINGVITEAQHGAIEDVLIPVRNEVLAGQWISAKQKLEEIGTSIGVDLYDRLHGQITDYIVNNY